MDAKYHLFKPNQTVVDLASFPLPSHPATFAPPLTNGAPSRVTHQAAGRKSPSSAPARAAASSAST